MINSEWDNWSTWSLETNSQIKMFRSPNFFYFRGYAILYAFCGTELWRTYNVISWNFKGASDYQSNKIRDQLTENKHSDNHNYPKIIPLISLNGKRQCVKVPRVLYSHVSNRLTNPEYFYHQMIIISISQWKKAFKWVSTNMLSDV